MSIDNFLIKDTTPGKRFVSLFLASPDFLKPMIQDIGNFLSLPRSSKRSELLEAISDRYENIKLQKYILKVLVDRPRNWLSIKQSDDPIILGSDFEDAAKLIYSMGESDVFYGAIQTEKDPDAIWLIKPSFFEHWDHQDVEPSTIRWLTYIRIWRNVVSLHWGGFTHNDDVKRTNKSRRRFAYWDEIPRIFDELESILNIQLRNIKLHELVLGDLWDNYRRKENYEWIDRRVRAEASGVFLNARSGGMIDISLEDNDNGLNSLANSIWNAIEYEFKYKHKDIELPSNHEFRDVVLGTIIRDLGAISYELELNRISDGNEKEPIIRGHFYFGSKENSSSPDAFPHVKLHISKFDHLFQLGFLLNHIGDKHVDKPRQNSLF